MEIWTAVVLSTAGEFHGTCVGPTEQDVWDQVQEQFDPESEWAGTDKDWGSFGEFFQYDIHPNPHEALDLLKQFRVNFHEDKPDPELCCERCGDVLCDLEHKDTFDVLIRTMLDHTCELQSRPAMGIQSCLLEFDDFDDNGDRWFKCVVHEDRDDLEGSHMVLGGEVNCEKATYEGDGGPFDTERGKHAIGEE